METGNSEVFVSSDGGLTWKRSKAASIKLPRGERSSPASPKARFVSAATAGRTAVWFYNLAGSLVRIDSAYPSP